MTNLTQTQHEEVLERIRLAHETLSFIPPAARSPRLQQILEDLKRLDQEEYEVL